MTKPCGGMMTTGVGNPMMGTNTMKKPLMAKGMKMKMPGQHKGTR